MTIEDRVGRALTEEAVAREVDLQALYADTLARAAEESSAQAPVRHRGRRWVAPAVVAATVLGVLGVSLTQTIGGIDLDLALPSGGTAVEGVDEQFSCPTRETYDWTRPETVTDDYYVASLRGGPRQQADTWRAPRYSYQEDGDTAFLRFGNRDGTLATLSEFHRVEGEWTRWSTEFCASPGSMGLPLDDELTLGRRAGAPYPVNALGGRAGPALLIDDREFYDGIGLVRHRSIWAEPCGEQMCFSAIHDRTSMVTTQTTARDEGRPRDLSDVFWPPDEMVGRTNPYAFYVLHDPDDEIRELRGEDEDGTVRVSQAFTDSSWPGRLHALLVPASSVASVTVAPREGAPRTHRPEDLPGWRAPED